MAVLWLRSRRVTCCRRQLADRDLSAQRRRPPGLARRRPGPYRRPSRRLPRRAPAVELAEHLARSGSLMTHDNKVHSVQPIGLVARDLDKTDDEIADLALGMDPEDGLIWVYSLEHEDGIMALHHARHREPGNAHSRPGDRQTLAPLWSSPYGYHPCVRPARAAPHGCWS